ncbi:MAG: hypothetical protein V3V97_18695 [Hyphomicrobiaceae bacterium]
MNIWKIAGSAVIAGAIAGGSVAAEEQTLKFRLVTTKISGSFMDVANVKGRSVGAGEYAGVAIFEDGRIAYKNFVLMMDSTDEKGSYSGYSTYTFQNGDALTLKFTGGWSSEGDGGDYEVLSGTGAFKGASGTGRFDAMKEPWEGANLAKGSFSLKLAGS